VRERERRTRRRGGAARREWRLRRLACSTILLLLSPPLPSPSQGTAGHPRKRFYRARAHANPLNDGYYADLPDTPGEAPWGDLYPQAFARAASEGRPPPRVTVADVGCGFGGLLVRLEPHLPPGELALGIELRDKVCDYVRGRAAALRAKVGGGGGGGGGGEDGKDAAAPAAPSSSSSKGEAIAALRVNAQRHLPSLFPARSLSRLFFLFPDPHFKARAARRRIVTPPLVGEYSALLVPGGILYTATDVEELGGWMRRTVHGSGERMGGRERGDSRRARARARAFPSPPVSSCLLAHLFPPSRSSHFSSSTPTPCTAAWPRPP